MSKLTKARFLINWSRYSGKYNVIDLYGRVVFCGFDSSVPFSEGDCKLGELFTKRYGGGRTVSHDQFMVLRTNMRISERVDPFYMETVAKNQLIDSADKPINNFDMVVFNTIDVYATLNRSRISRSYECHIGDCEGSFEVYPIGEATLGEASKEYRDMVLQHTPISTLKYHRDQDHVFRMTKRAV